MSFIFIALVFLLIFLVITVIIYGKYKQLRPYNQKPLDIKTFDKSDSPYHPSVLYFKEGWNGYKYWLAETPFSPLCKPYIDRNECPSIHVSNNGTTWSEITRNPIDNLNNKEIEELDYFSDPHLVYADGYLECWYRFTHRKGKADYYDDLQLVRKKSKDGITWGEREILVNLATSEGDALGNAVVSPAVLYSNGKYRMWYVNSESRKYRGLSYSESTDGRNWAKKSDCVLTQTSNMPWHIDVNFIDGKYILINYDFNNITIWESYDGINFKYIRELLSPSTTGSFYAYSLYRACIIKDKNYKVYFSGNDSFQTYIGLMEGDSIENLKINSEGEHTTFSGYIKLLYRKKRRSIQFIAKRLVKKLGN